MTHFVYIETRQVSFELRIKFEFWLWDVISGAEEETWNYSEHVINEPGIAIIIINYGLDL